MSVTFNNTSTNLNPVQLVGDLEPSSVTVDATRNYTFAGTGSITGTATLTKQGTGTLTITNANSYTGTTTISGGTLQIGNGGTSGALGSGSGGERWHAYHQSKRRTLGLNVISGSGNVRHIGTGTTTVRGASTYAGATTIEAGTVKSTDNGSFGDPIGGAVTISAGATLDVGGSNTVNNTNFGVKQFNVVGTGVGGMGAIINSNVAVGQQNAFQSITLTGNTTFGAYGRFDVRGGIATLDLAGFTLTKKGADHFGVVAGTIADGNVVVEEGLLALEGATTVQDFATGKKITFQNGTRLQFFGTTGGTITRPMEFNGAVNVHNNAGANSASTFDSPVTLKGSATYTFQNTGQTITQNGVISEMGGPRGIEVETTTTSALTLTAANTYTGSTSVSGAGTLNLSPISGISDLANTSIVSVANESFLGLNYSGTDTIRALLLDGVSVVPGEWGPVGSLAPNQDARLTGFGTLTVTAKILPGDFNNDAKVDAVDYVVWRNNEGTFNILANDPYFGTAIDADQYAVWRANFGKTLPGSGGGAGQLGAVPEPGAIVLGLFALVGAVFLRSRGA